MTARRNHLRVVAHDEQSPAPVPPLVAALELAHECDERARHELALALIASLGPRCAASTLTTSRARLELLVMHDHPGTAAAAREELEADVRRVRCLEAQRQEER